MRGVMTQQRQYPHAPLGARIRWRLFLHLIRVLPREWVGMLACSLYWQLVTERISVLYDRETMRDPEAEHDPFATKPIRRSTQYLDATTRPLPKGF